ncbi:D-alanyl-D-alanine carboxypeptidase, partial [Pasteurella multocida]|uniref:D-alanyl-D-alanine carboxypeptidase n=1 Tax=Pasteurella multocida TaxID=747 RepID=UPI00227A1B1F
LYGDVIVQGSGDPKLENERLYQLLAMIKAQGIKQVQGNLIIDNQQFQGVDFDVNAFDGKGLRPYNAQPNALLTNFGTVEVDLVPIAKPNAIAAIKPAKASASGSSATT